ENQWACTVFADYNDKISYAQFVSAFCGEPSYQPITFTSRCPGHIVPVRWSKIFGWSKIFQLDTEQGKPDNKAIAEMHQIIKQHNWYLQSMIGIN
ncbi:unnamed protein product, partial [Rotaria sp. Silwood1]